VLCGFLSVLVIVRWSGLRKSVIEFIELYKRKEIIWDPKHPMYFNKIRKQDAWEDLGKEMKNPIEECVSANLS